MNISDMQYNTSRDITHLWVSHDKKRLLRLKKGGGGNQIRQKQIVTKGLFHAKNKQIQLIDLILYIW